MNCQDCPDFLDAYLDNELDVAISFRVQLHLHKCKACQTAFASGQTLQTLLRGREVRFEHPPELRESVILVLAREVAATEAAVRKEDVILLLIFWAIAAALVFFAGLTLFNPAAMSLAMAQGPMVAE